jgi:hypothetical protein
MKAKKFSDTHLFFLSAACQVKRTDYNNPSLSRSALDGYAGMSKCLKLHGADNLVQYNATTYRKYFFTDCNISEIGVICP